MFPVSFTGALILCALPIESIHRFDLFSIAGFETFLEGLFFPPRERIQCLWSIFPPGNLCLKLFSRTLAFSSLHSEWQTREIRLERNVLEAKAWRSRASPNFTFTHTLSILFLQFSSFRFTQGITFSDPTYLVPPDPRYDTLKPTSAIVDWISLPHSALHS